MAEPSKPVAGIDTAKAHLDIALHDRPGCRRLSNDPEGRHRYIRLASPEVAQAIEALMVLVATGPHLHHHLPSFRGREAEPGIHDRSLRLGAAERAVPNRGFRVLASGEPRNDERWCPGPYAARF